MLFRRAQSACNISTRSKSRCRGEGTGLLYTPKICRLKKYSVSCKPSENSFGALKPFDVKNDGNGKSLSRYCSPATSLTAQPLFGLTNDKPSTSPVTTHLSRPSLNPVSLESLFPSECKQQAIYTHRNQLLCLAMLKVHAKPPQPAPDLARLDQL